jgi:simple sugar transport system permease protein
MTLGLLFAALTQGLAANQVATGLALTILGLGLASLAGQAFVGIALRPLQPLPLPLLSSIPVLGPALFRHDPMVYFALLAPIMAHLWLSRSHAGLILRSVGDAHHVAHALGYRVRMIRAGAIGFGAAMAGLGGAYLSLAVTPLWAENMTAGRGWIALALVVFAGWYAPRLLTGAFLFGFVLILQLHGQAMGLTIPSQILSMLPYAITIVALVLFSQSARLAKAAGAPRMLGVPFMPTR